MQIGSQSARQLHLHTTLPLPAKIKQIDGLQIMRAVAVILVIWFHAGLDPRIPDLGSYGVDIFFVISGFILSCIVLNSTAQPGGATSWHFLQRRLIRIYPIYWLFAILELARKAHSHVPSIYTYLPSLSLLPLPQFPPILLVAWTLMFEMFFYCVMAAILLCTVRRAAWAVIPLLCVAGAAGSIWDTNKPFIFLACNPILLEFAYGATLAHLYDRFGRRRLTGIALLVAGVALSLYFHAHPLQIAYDPQEVAAGGPRAALRAVSWGVAAALLVSGIVFWSPQTKTRAGRLAVILGNASYSIYLGSLLVLRFSLRGILKLFPSPGAPETWSVIRLFMIQFSETLAVLLVGWLSYQFIEWPMLRALQRKLVRT